MINDRTIVCLGRVAVSLVMVIVGCLLATTEPPFAWAASPERFQETPKVNDAPVRAYEQPTLRSATLHRVTLTVLDDETSRPLDGVEVRISHDVDWRTRIFRTDSHGRLVFEYPSLPGEFTVSLAVRKDGYVPLARGWGYEGASRPPNAVTYRLRRGITMGGLVVDEAGQSIEGAIVLMSLLGGGRETRPANPTGFEFYQQIPTRTGPDGRWRTDSVPPGATQADLRLIHPDFLSDGPSTLGRSGRSPKIATLLDQSDRQVLAQGIPVVGRVVDELGRPIAGARIHDSERYLNSAEYPWCRPTDADGRFHLRLPRGQPSRLTAEAAGYAFETLAVDGRQPTPAVEFTLATAKRLRVRVVAPDDQPIEGVQVRVLSDSSRTFPQLRRRTDSNGGFEWESAPAGRVLLNLAAEGYLAKTVRAHAGAGDGNVTTLQPAVDVRLDAVDASTGEAISRFGVEIGRRDPKTNGFSWGPRMGRSAPMKFQMMLEAEEGPYHFRISADGYKPVRILVPSTRTVLRKSFKLEKATK
jgi:hypothetical protein